MSEQRRRPLPASRQARAPLPSPATRPPGRIADCPRRGREPCRRSKLLYAYAPDSLALEVHSDRRVPRPPRPRSGVKARACCLPSSPARSWSRPARRCAAFSLGGLLGGGRRKHCELAVVEQEAEEAGDRLGVGCVEDEQQAMLPVDQRLGLDGDAVTGRLAAEMWESSCRPIAAQPG